MSPAEIKELRVELGLSQPEFLERLGITTSTLSAARQTVFRWETGKRRPSAAALVLLEQLRDRSKKVGES